MKNRRLVEKARINAVIFAFILLTAIFAPLAMSTHLSELPGLMRPSDVFPESGIDPLDNAVGTAASILDPLVDELNERLSQLDEPQNPAMFFLDNHFGDDPATRLGGWGDWGFLGDEGWNHDPRQSESGMRSMSFWDPEDGRYPIGPTDHHAFLVSPRISLQSLPIENIGPGDQYVDLTAMPDQERDNFVDELERRCDQDVILWDPFVKDLCDAVIDGGGGGGSISGTVGGHIPLNLRDDAEFGTGQEADPHRIIAYVDHRHHLANMRDVGRLEIFLEPPSAGDIHEDTGVIVHPMREEYEESDNMGEGFTGFSDWTTEAFDLSEWAGNDVWLVFRTAVEATNSPRSHYFSNSNLFNTADTDFFGWAIDEIRIEGPAHFVNLRIDEILAPRFTAENQDDLWYMNPGENEMGFLLINRGRFSEQSPTVSMMVSKEGSPWGFCSYQMDSIRPGESRAVFFDDCPELPRFDPGTYSVTYQVTTLLNDGFPQDNQRTFNVEVWKGDPPHLDGPIAFQPRTAERFDARELRIDIRNPSFSPVEVHAELQITMQDPLNPDDWVDVTTDPAIVQFTDSTDVPFQQVKIEADPADETNRGSAQWGFMLAEPGTYRAHVDVFHEGNLIASQTLSASTEVLLADVLFADTFQSTEGVPGMGDSIVGPPGSDWRRWTMEETLNLSPPDCVLGGCDESHYVWEAFRDDWDREENSPLSSGIEKPVLMGQFTGENLPVGETFVEEIRITYEHYLQGRYSEAFTELVLIPRSETSQTRVSVPVDGRDSGAAIERLKTYGTPLGHQNLFYGTQWVQDEIEFSFLTDDLEDNLGDPPTPLPRSNPMPRSSEGIPVELLDEMAILFGIRTRHGDNPNLNGMCLDGPGLNCPTWRMSRIDVTAITQSGLEVLLLRFSGDEGETVGKWNSYIHIRPEGVAGFPSRAVRTSQYDACLNETIDEPESAALNRMRCQGWRHRPIAELQPPEGSWRHEGDTTDLRHNNFWTTAWGDGWIYPDGKQTRLVTPALSIPPDVLEPTFSFEHTYRFMDQGSPLIDGGSLFVRTLHEGAGGAISPTSPYYPVVIWRDNPNDLQMFRGNDCDQYPSHPAGMACLERMIADREMVHHPPLPLNDLWVRDMRIGSHGDVISLDLRGEIVQFAFQKISYPLPDNDQLNKGRGLTPQQEGWYLGNVTLLGSSMTAYDLAVSSIGIETDYPWEDLGLGPDTDAIKNIRLENRGMFTVNQAVLNVTAENALTGDRFYLVDDLPTPPDFTVEPGEETDLPLPVKMPDLAGSYRMIVRTELVGEIRPGLSIVDGNPTNNCASIDGEGNVFLNICSFDQAPLVRVEPFESLEVDLRVSPLAGRESFPRTIGITVKNIGNVIVNDARLQLSYQTIGAEAVPDAWSHTWTLAESPPPGQSRQWQELEAEPAHMSTIVLNEAERYMVQSSIFKPGLGSSVIFFHADQALADSYATFYADTFEPFGLTGTMVEETIQPQSGNWTLQTGMNFAGDPDGNTAWYLGDPGTGTYPDLLDESMYFPPLDLSTVQQAVFSFAHNYRFEEGYDGGVLEATLDDGETWMPLNPQNGYPGRLAAANPMNAENDPLNLVPAFTGDSSIEAPFLDGWMISEFNLGQIPGFTTPILVHRLDQDGFIPFEDVQNRPVDDRFSGLSQWSLPGRSCPDHCWIRLNENHNWPERNPEGLVNGDESTGPEVYWWSRNLQQGSSQDAQAYTDLFLNVSHEWTLGQGQRVRLTYWQWQDSDLDPQLFFTPDSGSNEWVPFSGSATVMVIDEETGWTKREAIFETPALTHLNPAFAFRYRENFANPEANRGAVIDDVKIELVRIQTLGGVEVIDSIPVLPDSPRYFAPNTRTGTGPPVLGASSVGVAEILGWELVDRVTDTPDAWKPYEHPETRIGQQGTVWLFGDEGEARYPANARESLITPRMSLRDLGGASAQLEFWERYQLIAHQDGTDIDGMDHRVDHMKIWAEPLVPTLDGDVPGEWVLIHNSPTRTNAARFATDTDCEDTHFWCRVQVDVSQFIGTEVRFAFQVVTGKRDPLVQNLMDEDLGFHWAIDEVGLIGETIVGQPVQLRLRAGTDKSINEGHWIIDNPQLVGSAYQKNVAVLPSVDPGQHRLAPGTEWGLEGIVRNLAGFPERDLSMGVTVIPIAPPSDPDMIPEPPTISFEETPRGLSFVATPDGAMSEGVTLMPAGRDSDRRPYNLTLAFPEGVPDGSRYRIEIGLLNAANAPFIDENLGDHERIYDVVLETAEQLEVIEKTVLPASVEPGEKVSVRVAMMNQGTTEAGANVDFVARNIPMDPNEIPPGPLPINGVQFPTMMPGGVEEASIDWIPEDVGFYRLEALVERQFGSGGFTQTEVLGHVLVGMAPIFYEENFTTAPFGRGWATTTPTNMDNRASDPCQKTATNYNAGQAAPWQWITWDRFSGEGSMFIGTDDPDRTYPATRDEMLVGPWIDLRFLADLIEIEDSPLTPNLNFRYKSSLGANQNNGVIVQASLLDVQNDVPSQLMQGTAYNGEVRCDPDPLTATFNPLAHSSVIPNLALNQDTPLVRPAIVGNTPGTQWQAASHPLDVVRHGAAEFLIVGEQFSPVFRLGTATNGGSGFHVDHVTVSAYDMSVEPAHQEIELSTGADKSFYFWLENTGAARDTFMLRIDPARTAEQFTDGSFEVKLPSTSVTLEPGESRLVEIQVRVPNSLDVPRIRNADITIEVMSISDVNRLVHPTIRVVDLDRTPLPDLSVELTRPSGEGTQIVQGDSLTYLVKVSNIGNAPAPKTEVVLFACKADKGIQDDLRKCKEAKQSGDLQHPHHPVELRTIPVDGLPSILDAGRDNREQTEMTHTFNWVVPLEVVGSHHVIGVVDPEQRIRQYGRDNTVASDLVEILPLDRPNLVVSDLKVSDLAGAPTERAFAGDVLRISGTVTNVGNADAQNVMIRILNQFPLREDRIGRLAPGQSVEIATQWIAQSGNSIVVLEASTSTPESDSSNNVQRWPLAVQRGTLELTASKETFQMAPGDSTAFAIGLRNTRQATFDGWIDANLPVGFGISGLPDALTIERSAREEALVILSTPSDLDDGIYSLTLDARNSPEGPPLATLGLSVSVASDRILVFESEPLVTPPGRVHLAFQLTNEGTSPDLVDLSVQPPEGWEVTLSTSRFRIESGMTRTVQATVEIPPGTPPGAYALVHEDSSGHLGELQVQVTPRAVWESKIHSVRQDGPGLELWIEVMNTGNIPGSPRDMLQGFSERQLKIEPPLGPLEPGRSAFHKVQVTDKDLDATGLFDIAGMALEPDYEPRLSIRQIEVLQTRTQQRQGPMFAEILLHNDGDRMVVQAPLRVYVDGELAATHHENLPRGESRTVQSQIRLDGEEHTIIVVAGSGQETTSKAFLYATEQDEQGIPFPSAVSFIVAALVLVFVLRSRRRCQT